MSYAVSTRTLALYQSQLSILAAMIIVFATFGVNMNIFSKRPWQEMLSAAWLLILILDVIWLVFFSFEHGPVSTKSEADLERGIVNPSSVELEPQTNSEKHPNEGRGLPDSHSQRDTNTHPYTNHPQRPSTWIDSPIGPTTSGEISAILDTSTLHPSSLQAPVDNHAGIPNPRFPFNGGSDRDTPRNSLNAPTTQTASSSVRPTDFTIRVEALYSCTFAFYPSLYSS